ncbi:hypothetical protein V2J09_013784 [Rumex salicifolius]
MTTLVNQIRLSLFCLSLLRQTSSVVIPPINDDYVLPEPTPPPHPPSCHTGDKSALLRIKQSLNNSDVFDTWRPETNCCSDWKFVKCNGSTGRVTLLAFTRPVPRGTHGLPAGVPSAVGDLSDLNVLVFRNNETGPIPGSLAKLRELTYLDLAFNGLSGRIPGFLAWLPKLHVIHLEGNRLTGRIPENLSYNTSLQVVYLDDNKLSGRIPELFGNFKYSGPEAGIVLYMSGNRLTGPIPRSFGNVTFWHLNLAGNRLSGDASFLFGRDKMMWLMNLSGNRLAFNLTNLERPQELTEIRLDRNKIFGSVPVTLITSRLNVSYNRLCGPIPPSTNPAVRLDASAFDHNKCLCNAPLPPCA